MKTRISVALLRGALIMSGVLLLLNALAVSMASNFNLGIVLTFLLGGTLTFCGLFLEAIVRRLPEWLWITCLCGLSLVILSAGTTVLFAMGMVQTERLKLMVFCQLFALLFSALLGSYQLIEGMVDLFRARFSLNTMLVVTFLACLVSPALLKSSRYERTSPE